MDDRQKQMIAECESFGEDEVRCRFYAGEYNAPRDRLLVEGWLQEKESTKNLLLQNKNASIQKWILRLTIAILILAALSVGLSILSYKPLDMQPHKDRTQPKEKNYNQQTGILKSTNKITK